MVVVHFGDPQRAAELLASIPGTQGFHLVADPERRLYRSFGLGSGSLRQIMGPRVWLRGARAFFSGFRPGKPQGDLHQMSGAFVVRDGRVTAAHPYRDSTDHPDFLRLLATSPE